MRVIGFDAQIVAGTQVRVRGRDQDADETPVLASARVTYFQTFNEISAQS